MDKDKKIELLTQELVRLLNEKTEESSGYQQGNLEICDNLIMEMKSQGVSIKTCHQTIDELNSLNVDTNIVRQIMKRVDEVYGRKHSLIHSASLSDSLGTIIKNLE